jgi:hypothetical protein
MSDVTILTQTDFGFATFDTLFASIIINVPETSIIINTSSEGKEAPTV